MAPSRKTSNGRSPLVNPQRQITSFFSKSSSSPSPTLSKPNPNPKSYPSPSTPSPAQTKQKKPLLVIGPSPSSPKTPESLKKSYGTDAVNKRVRVYWPLDKTWYEGCVKSFDKTSGNHLIQYDDAVEEFLDLSKEKIEFLEVEETVTKFKRLRRLSKKAVIDDDEDVEVEEKNVEDDDDSGDEDWRKNIGDEVIEDCSEDMNLVNEEEEEEEVLSKSDSKSRKRKRNGVSELGSGRKSKSCSALEKKASSKVSVDIRGGAFMDKLNNVENSVAPGDNVERFALREEQKLRFLAEDHRDAKRRRPGDENYDPRTLYLPPDFLRSLSGGQRQWWEFKSKHMDKVLFFKMGKFYELFEMDAHVCVKELGLQYMKGEQPHCGFPEKNFSANVEKLARKGYRVLVVEQTETPEQLELRRKQGSKDKVVKREICAVVTKGTLTEGEMLTANPDSSYLMSLTESYQTSEKGSEERTFGVCMVDVSTSRIILGQFEDDSKCNTLSSLLSELRPVEIVKPAKQLSSETEKVLMRHTRSPLVNELVPIMEFWDAEKTICELRGMYNCLTEQSICGTSNNEEPSFHAIHAMANEQGLRPLPDVLSNLISAGKNGSCALSALGGALFYLKQAFLDVTLLRFAKFELLPCLELGNIQKSYMVLDAAALENLEIFENSKNGGSSGTLYAQLNHCITACGKRLLKSWLARPLYQPSSIRARQDAVACLKGVNLSLTFEFRKALSRLPDMERLLARLFSNSEANGRNASKVVLYEDAAKKQLQEFISALRGCELMIQTCSSLSAVLENSDSVMLCHLLTSGKGLPDVDSVLQHFKDAFDWVDANDSGRIIPHEGVDSDYDSACKLLNEIESHLKKHLKEQRRLLGDLSINYVTVGKEAYLLEVPESLCESIPRDYELRSSKKGFYRYWTPTIKKLVGELSQAESEKESALKSILQRLVGKFCEHHDKWRKLVSTIAELDALISLAIASDYFEGPACRPTLTCSSCSNKVPCLKAKSLGHPVIRSDSLGKGTFVPNDICIGGSDPGFILLTGPNMGGKSTLMRQVCLAVILSQIGADVPAEAFELSPVDRIFVRMGAKDHIMAGQSTFLTELSETASMLTSATCHSLVALDELGRGTSTSDGQAIAEAVLEHFVHKVQCRGMFSTHYHRLSVDYQKNSKISLFHMACQVGEGNEGAEEVTFLYKLTRGACPKSYGVNVARLAGLPDSVLLKAGAKSRDFEANYGKHRTGPQKILL
ncbi:DNA mismatch repair protein MutS, connector domain [Dillenia turbinata]|uniref:DNA mismatch repair protein n=1 Tax=Dillenia turbinata TaxID=194707 RepID=A0AAN8ZKC2_9MAGN